MIFATTFAGCAEMQTFRKIGYYIHFDATDDSTKHVQILFPAQ